INHLDGGLDRLPGGGYSRDRLDSQLDLLLGLDADIVLSTEGKGWLEDDAYLLGYIAHRLGMLPYVARAPRHDCNLVIWLRSGRFRDIAEHHELHPPFWHAQARVSTAVDGVDERLWVFAAHYSPFVPEIQGHEAKATADLADGRLVLGGGDFQDDGYGDPAPDRSAMPANQQLRHRHPAGQSPAEVLHTAGFTDVAAALGRREPTAGFNDGAALRCDRLYTGARLAHAARSYAVLDKGHELSDHRIIHAELDLSAAL
ncbi:MAG: hypothetical protein ACRDRL_26075, partial [Sciscionella sp.]